MIRPYQIIIDIPHLWSKDHHHFYPTFNFFVRDDHSLSCLVFVNHISTFLRSIASCCHRVTFSHTYDVLVVALDMLKMPNARVSGEYACSLFCLDIRKHSKLLMCGVIGKGLIR